MESVDARGVRKALPFCRTEESDILPVVLFTADGERLLKLGRRGISVGNHAEPGIVGFRSVWKQETWLLFWGLHLLIIIIHSACAHLSTLRNSSAYFFMRNPARRRRFLPNWPYQMALLGAKSLSDGAKKRPFLGLMSVSDGLKPSRCINNQ